MKTRGSFLVLLAAAPHLAYAESDKCANVTFGPPLSRQLQVVSRYNPENRHFGVDYEANGDLAVAIADGVVEKIAWDERALFTKDPRSGAKVKGWGRYVIVRHPDGSRMLYAHLEKESVNHLKLGQTVKVGDPIGKTDSTGGVSGPHLHVEYMPTGDVYNNGAKADPDRCIARHGWMKVENYPGGGICEVFVSGRLIGENQPGQVTKLALHLRLGKHPIRVIAKQVNRYRKATCSVEFDTTFTILDSSDAILGPGLFEELEQGGAVDSVLLVR